MGVDFNKSVGFEQPDTPVAWNKRDLLLYAVGIGAGENDLDLVYELDKRFRAFPTYPLVLGLKGEGQDVNLFADRIGGRNRTPGFPVLDPNTIVHGEQSIEILKDIPVESGPGWKIKQQVTGVHDKGSALILEGAATLVSPSGEPYVRMLSSTFYRGGGQKTGFSKTIVPKPTGPKPPKDRQPDFVHREKTGQAQAVLYRLSGDYNPLHIDPKIGKRGGLGGTILHGLCSYGFAARAILKAASSFSGTPTDGIQLKLMSSRFTSPVKPGDELETRVWKVGDPGPDGEVQLAFEQVCYGKGKPSLGMGIARVKVARPASKL